MATSYPLPTGEADRLRLERLNKLYNPIAQQFLIDNGLQPGMSVLEIGCGIGDMACWLSQLVGPQGKVVGIDNSAAQIDICGKKAHDKGITNSEFICMDVHDISNLNQQFDMIYGRWVIIFIPQPKSVFKELVQVLKPGGVLTYETITHADKGFFSYPHTKVVDQWFASAYKVFKQNDYNHELGQQLYHLFNELKLQDINLCINQPILITPEDKSVLRLGALGMCEEFLKFMDKKTYEQLIYHLEVFEQATAITGFFRNMLAAGRKKN